MTTAAHSPPRSATGACLVAVAIACVLSAPAPAVAAPEAAAPVSQTIPEAATTAPAASRTRRLVAGGALVLPGLMLHGSGHFALGDRRTATRLLRWEGIGLASVVAGLGGLALTGASSRTVALFIPLTAAGVGLFGLTWLADVYGVVAPAGGLGDARRTLPRIEGEAGLRYVHDRVFAYRTFAVVAADVWMGRFRATPSAWVAVGHDNARLRAFALYRFVGPRAAGPPAADGSHVDLEFAFTHHRYGAERFALTLGEAALAGRLDLSRLAPSLAGSFVEGAVGFAAGGITYFGVTTDATDLLLARFGWGVFLGRGAHPRGEALLYYDHRHDGFAAGLKVPGLGSGAGGHFGLRALAYLSTRLGVGVDAQAGSAYVVGASLLVRQGETP